MIGSISKSNAKSSQKFMSDAWTNWKRKAGEKSRKLLIERGWLLFFIGFLLGRVIILSSVSPFAVAFIASVWMLRRKLTLKLTAAVLAGALSVHIHQAILLSSAIMLFFTFAVLLKKVKHQQRLVPLLVFFSYLISRMGMNYIQGQWTTYQWMFSIVEASLSVVLVYIFMQSVPLLSPKRYKQTLKNEEIVCMMILLASVLTGTIGWVIYDASVEQVLSRYFVLWFAFVAGAAIGSTVGVVTGLILSLANVASLYQMSLLAFSGLLGGLLKDGKKIGVGLGLFVGTLLIGIYWNEGSGLTATLMETGLAVLLFFLTPESWIKRAARYIPGTSEHSKEQEKYMQKVRDVTASRVEQFSDMFQALSKSFSKVDVQEREKDDKKEIDYFLSNVTEKTCQSCFKKENCWVRNFDQTYQYMQEMMDGLEDGSLRQRQKLLRNFENHCIKSNKVIETMKHEFSFYLANQRLKKQVKESRRFVADQLKGVSDVMEEFAKEIMRERKIQEKKEEEIVNALKDMGFEIEKLEIYSLEAGNVDIEMTLSFYDYHGEASKLIAPVLSEILNETIEVKHEEVSPFPNGYGYFVFKSAKKYSITTGVAHAAKGGGLVSGDSHLTMELGTGRYALAISDGMGNGERAYIESMDTLSLLQQILQSGIDEKVAIKSINSILSLRTTDEIFSTLDLAVIDLHNAGAKFLKIGSTPSFVKRGNQVLKIEASNLPIGIIQEFDVDVVSEQLKPGDLLIMMSDGVFEGPKHVENTDVWLKRKIREIETDDPQAVSDLILEEVFRSKDGEIDDDMTVLVAKIENNVPRWAAFPIYKEAK
ncbi:MAG: stage II sporulation protein E [Bacillaceae bacterium]|nr:stage II sporulation protein E [Bacillaceae bacterium]